MVQAIQIAIAILGLLLETGCTFSGSIDRIPSNGGEIESHFIRNVPGRPGWSKRPQFTEEEAEVNRTLPRSLHGLK